MLSSQKVKIVTWCVTILAYFWYAPVFNHRWIFWIAEIEFNMHCTNSRFKLVVVGNLAQLAKYGKNKWTLDLTLILFWISFQHELKVHLLLLKKRIFFGFFPALRSVVTSVFNMRLFLKIFFYVWLAPFGCLYIFCYFFCHLVDHLSI